MVRQLLEAVGKTPEDLLRAQETAGHRAAARSKREIMVDKGGMRGA